MEEHELVNVYQFCFENYVNGESIMKTFGSD